ncbi:MAG: putative rane protein [Lachnospiraceae bacterium]|jgi:FlaA1/EpsC-like NDP-sugar epimerase|nr:putative rane protein [Lachnospiraceae bacterium]
MLKDNPKILNKLHVLVDACTIIIAYLFTYYLRFLSPFFTENLGTYHSLGKYSVLLVYLVPIYLFLYYLFRLYTPKWANRKWQEIVKIILSNSFGIVLFTITLYFQKEFNISRRFLILYFVINVTLSICLRMLFSYSLKLAHRKEYN